MPRLRCNTCRGEYDTVGADGVVYFHACPDIFDEATQRFVPRADKRDENVVPASDARGRARPRHEGRGVTVIRP